MVLPNVAASRPARRPVETTRPSAPQRSGIPVCLAVALASGAAAYVLVVSGWFKGSLAASLFIALLVLAPTHEQLARRVSLNTALVLGWSQVLWWIAWPWPVNHGGIVLGLGWAATVAAWLRGRRAAPIASGSEIAILLAAPLAAAAAVSRWLFRSPREALEQMLPGWDNAPHFAMFWGLREHGAVPQALKSGADGSTGGYDNYPKGFHTSVATMSEMLLPRLDDGVSALPAYLNGQAAVVMLGVLMVAATMVGAPRLRERPFVLVPALTLSCTALLWEPGQEVFADGFTGFWLGAVAAGVALLMAATMTRPSIADVAAVAGLLLLVTYCWLPLIVLAAPAAALVLFPYLGPRWSSRSSTLAVLILVAAGLGCMRAAWLLITIIPMNGLVRATGGYHAPAVMPILALVLAGTWALLVLGSRSATTSDDPVVGIGQARLLLITPILGAVLLGALLAAQLSITGAADYYFFKLLLGYELVLAVVVPAVVAGLVAALIPQSRRKIPAILGSAMLTLASLAAFGLLTPGHAALFDREDPGTAGIVPPLDRADMADGLLAVVRATGQSSTTNTVYLALGRARANHVLLPDLWFHAFDGSSSPLATSRIKHEDVTVSTPESAAVVVAGLLERQPHVVIYVAQEELATLEAQLSPRWASRLVTIPSTESASPQG